MKALNEFLNEYKTYDKKQNIKKGDKFRDDEGDIFIVTKTTLDKIELKDENGIFTTFPDDFDDNNFSVWFRPLNEGKINVNDIANKVAKAYTMSVLQIQPEIVDITKDSFVLLIDDGKTKDKYITKDKYTIKNGGIFHENGGRIGDVDDDVNTISEYVDELF